MKKQPLSTFETLKDPQESLVAQNHFKKRQVHLPPWKQNMTKREVAQVLYTLHKQMHLLFPGLN